MKYSVDLTINVHKKCEKSTKGKQYKFPPLPKSVKGDKSLKFLTEQKLLIKYQKILQQNNIKCNIGHQMMQISNKTNYTQCLFFITYYS